MVSALSAAACSSDIGAAPTSSGGDAGGSCPRDIDTTGPDVSFESDLMPFFSTTCAFGGCHDGHTRQAGLYLGPNFVDGAADAPTRAEVLQSLLAVSTTAPSLHRVTPSNPKHSFLIIKIEGCQNSMGLSCGGAVKGKPCGDRMPALSDELPKDKQSLLARWIARGALGDGADAAP